MLLPLNFRVKKNENTMARSAFNILLFTLTLQGTRSIHDPMNRSKMNVMLLLTFTLKIIYNLGNKTVLCLICNCINDFVGL